MKGYKDLFETEEYRSEYRKRTRKEFLNHRLKQDPNGFQNPLKEAISNRKVDKTLNLYYIRQASKVAPSYLNRLKDLDEKDKELKVLENIQEKYKTFQRNHTLNIRFSQKVLEERSPVTYFRNHMESVWKEPDIIHSNEKSIVPITSSKEKDLSKIQVDHGLHKSSWLRDVERPETIRRLSVSVVDSNVLEGFKMELKTLKEDESQRKKETYSTRNVDYMLDIWQKSEKVNLDEFLREEERIKSQKKIKAKERSVELSKEKELKLEQNQLYLQAFDANVSRDSYPNDPGDKNKVKKPKESANMDGTVFQLTSLTEELSSIAEREVNHKRRKSLVLKPLLKEELTNKSESFSPRSIGTPTKKGSHLSESTINVLKRLSLEENGDSAQETPVIKSQNSDDIVKLTLTGPQEMDMQPIFLSDCNRSFVPIRVKRRNLETKYSPGAWSKLIKSSFLPNGEIRISDSISNEAEQDTKKFKLILHDATALDDEENENLDLTNDESQGTFDDAEEIDLILPEIIEENPSHSTNGSKEDISRPTPIQRRLSNFQRGLSVYSQKNWQSEKKVRTLEELIAISKERKEKERADSGRKYFSLTILCGLIKRFLNHHFEDKDLPFGLPSLPPGAPPLNKLGDFISGPYFELEYLPDNDPIARISLLRALSLALRETQQKELSYEAAQIILKSGLHAELGRWDFLLLKDILTQMLSDGSRSEKDLACIAFCESNQVNEEVIQHLKSGFGDLDDNRRQQLNFLFSNLELRFAPLVMDILMEETSNINFRVRLDVVHQIANYIERLSTTIEHPRVPKLEKYSSYERLDINQTKNTSPEPKEESQIDSMIFNSIEALLSYMWEVRDLASLALGRLKQGNAIYNHLISLTNSESPAKRLDALKCLGYMGIITETTLPDFIESFKDSYAAIRLQACKVACKLKNSHRDLIAALLDSSGDSSWKIRAFAIKAVGLSGSKSPKVITSLHWCAMHDEVPAVRAEAIVAFKNLGLVDSFGAVKEWLITLLQTDTSEAVKKEAEKVLVESGIMLPATNLTEDLGGDMMSSILARIPANLSLPFPNILGGKSKEEVEIFLRDSLIEDKEQSDVINQVRLLAKKEKVLEQVQYEERHSGILPKIHLDLNFDQDHIPNLKAIHTGRKTKVNPSFYDSNSSRMHL